MLSPVELGCSSIHRVGLKVEETPTNICLLRTAFLSFYKQPDEWYLGIAKSLSLIAGWTQRHQHCILQRHSLSSITFIFIPFYSFLHSFPF